MAIILVKIKNKKYTRMILISTACTNLQHQYFKRKILTNPKAFLYYVCCMPGKQKIKSTIITRHVVVLDTRDCFTCSFTEFLPFNSAMYYYSSFKAFKALNPA
jgi:hypothetical protein